MTVGELRQKLSIYEDDQTVLVQSPNEEEMWPLFPWLGEAEEGEIVVIITDCKSRRADEKRGRDGSG